MLAPKKGESISLVRRQYSNVIFVFSVVISISLLNGCIYSCVATEAETSFAPDHIENSCIEKCPDQVSWHGVGGHCRKFKNKKKKKETGKTAY